MRKVLTLALSMLASPALAADPSDLYAVPTPPFHVIGPVDYVGTQGIGVYLIRTSAGLILLDGGPRDAAPLVEKNIAALGHSLSDVKIIVATHAHWDHVGALAKLKRDTGARFLSSPADRRAYETGTPPSDTNNGASKFAPVRVDGVLTDGKPVRLGNKTMMPMFTPGHTPGCTSWAIQVVEGGRPYRVLFPCSMTVAGNKLVGNKGYPNIVADFRASFKRWRTVKADVVLPAHPEFADVMNRKQRRDAGDAPAFVSPDLLPRMVAQAGRSFEHELAKQDKGQ